MADTFDVLTYDEGKGVVGVGAMDDTKQNQLARLITTASRRLDEAIGPVVQRSVTSEIHDGGCSWIELQHGPILAVSSVVEYSGTGSTTITEETIGTSPDGFFAQKYPPNRSLLSGMLIRRVSGNDTVWATGRGNIAVSYLAGRVASTTNVDARHKEAAALILRNLWRSYENSVGRVDEYDVPVQSFPTFALPNAVKDLLVEELQTSAGFG